ncbi:MAG: tRNA (N6-threonylcarbamoyladenosine(37)-N6)-methyltransferase TrmO [Lentisphaeria bacterium]|nr:tRNA (N6-threonylcarbamoyladenosine(37)-N6)-methyltransferase TrmO [Lentisphaeria bacterium]
MNTSYSIEPIGIFRCGEQYRYETPRQGVFAENEGVIELAPGHCFEQAAADLNGFSRIWILFLFHLNETWNVQVRPPVAPDKRKIGVFATRSPHRPNRIGMSCVELISVEGLQVRVKNFDLLDRTPVIDIKPYIPRADAFPDAETGWLAAAVSDGYEVTFTPEMQVQAANLLACGGPDLQRFCRVQLVHAPLNRERKRLYACEDGSWEIGFRTWRIRFSAAEAAKKVRVLGIRSHYLPEELAPGTADPYQDKDLHRAWQLVMGGRADFGTNCKC